MLFYKFVHDTDDHKALESIIKGNIMFSKIPDLNDYSETRAVIDKDEIKNQ